MTAPYVIQNRQGCTPCASAAFACGPCNWPATFTITIKYRNSSGGITTSSGTWTFTHLVGGSPVGTCSIPFNNSAVFGPGSVATVFPTFQCAALTGSLGVAWAATQTSPTSLIATGNNSNSIGGPASFTCSPLSETIGNGTADINGSIATHNGIGVVECDITP